MQQIARVGLSAGLLSGCFLGGPGDSPPRGGSDGPFDGALDVDAREYDELVDSLERARVSFLDERADETLAVGHRLFWREYRTFDPTLHSYDAVTDRRVDYGFSIGEGDRATYRASESMVVTVASGTDELVYRAFRAGEPNRLLGELSMEPPPDAQRWWAYAVSEGSLYVMTTGERTVVHVWQPGGELMPVLTLEEAGVEVGELWDFGVEGSQLVLVESGRAWLVDLQTGRAQWLDAAHQATGPISFDERGVLVPTASGPLYHDLRSGVVIPIAEAIEAVDFRINDTFASADRYVTDAVMYGDDVVYIGGGGVFRFNVRTREVEPVLLHPRSADIRVSYRYPTVLSDGSLFVTGLESESGSVGADGPVWRVQL